MYLIIINVENSYHALFWENSDSLGLYKYCKMKYQDFQGLFKHYVFGFQGLKSEILSLAHTTGF